MYAFTSVIMIVCCVLLVLGLFWYARFQWVFWVYCGDGDGWLIPLLITLFFLLLYGQFIWWFGDESGATFFSSGLKLLFFSVLQIVLFNNRWEEMSDGNHFWEEHGRLLLPLFMVGVVALRFGFIVSDEYRTDYQWENAELHQVSAVGHMDFYAATPKRFVVLDNGYETYTKHTDIAVDQVVRLYDDILFVEQPQSGLKKGWSEIVGAIERKKARKAAEKRR